MEAALDSTTQMQQLHDRAHQRDRQHRPRHAERDRRARPAAPCSRAGSNPISDVTSSPRCRVCGRIGSSANRAGSTVSSTPKATSGVSTQADQLQGEDAWSQPATAMSGTVRSVARPTARNPTKISDTTKTTNMPALPAPVAARSRLVTSRHFRLAKTPTTTDPLPRRPARRPGA